MRMRTFASFIPVAALLAVCAVASRAPGGTLNAIIWNSLERPSPFEDCSTQGTVFEEAIGYRNDFSAACRIFDASGSTVSRTCDGATTHQAKLWSLVSAGAGGSGNDGGPTGSPPGPIRGKFYCSTVTTPWLQHVSCSEAISAKIPGLTQCAPVVFFANSMGTN